MIGCLCNVDTLNVCMKEFGSEKIIFDKMTSMRLFLDIGFDIELSGVNNFVYLILTNVPDIKD